MTKKDGKTYQEFTNNKYLNLNSFPRWDKQRKGIIRAIYIILKVLLFIFLYITPRFKCLPCRFSFVLGCVQVLISLKKKQEISTEQKSASTTNNFPVLNCCCLFIWLHSTKRSLLQLRPKQTKFGLVDI